MKTINPSAFRTNHDCIFIQLRQQFILQDIVSSGEHSKLLDPRRNQTAFLLCEHGDSHRILLGEKQDFHLGKALAGHKLLIYGKFRKDIPAVFTGDVRIGSRLSGLGFVIRSCSWLGYGFFSRLCNRLGDWFGDRFGDILGNLLGNLLGYRHGDRFGNRLTLLGDCAGLLGGSIHIICKHPSDTRLYHNAEYQRDRQQEGAGSFYFIHIHMICALLSYCGILVSTFLPSLSVTVTVTLSPKNRKTLEE